MTTLAALCQIVCRPPLRFTLSDSAMLAANLGMLLVALSWGTMIPSMKHLLLGWDPYFLALARYGLAVPPMLVLLRLTERDLPWYAGFAPWRWWLLGMVGIGFFPPLYTVGLAHCNPVTAAILSSTSPAITAIVGRKIGRAHV